MMSNYGLDRRNQEARAATQSSRKGEMMRDKNDQSAKTVTKARHQHDPESGSYDPLTADHPFTEAANATADSGNAALRELKKLYEGISGEYITFEAGLYYLVGVEEYDEWAEEHAKPIEAALATTVEAAPVKCYYRYSASQGCSRNQEWHELHKFEHDWVASPDVTGAPLLVPVDAEGLFGKDQPWDLCFYPLFDGRKRGPCSAPMELHPFAPDGYANQHHVFVPARNVTELDDTPEQPEPSPDDCGGAK